jgi:hypothetical protein
MGIPPEMMGNIPGMNDGGQPAECPMQ